MSKSDPFGLCATGSTWENIKNGAVQFIGGTLVGWAEQDEQIAASAAKYDSWYNQQTPFVQNAEYLEFAGIPPEYVTKFSDHKEEVLVLGTLAVLSRGLVRVGPLAEAGAANKGLGGNPFKGKAPQEIGDMLTNKGYVPKGPDPVAGQGTFLNPKTGRSVHIDANHPPPKPPHVSVQRPRDHRNLPPREYPLE
jgi:Bacterial toxin 37